MNIIIAGSRDFTDYETLCKIIKAAKLPIISSVICGVAKGADLLGKRFAEENNIPIKEFPADWDTFGKSAGYRRNVDMANYADACFLFWDGESKGTEHMYRTSAQKGLLTILVIYSPKC